MCSLEDELQQKPQMLTELKKNLQRLHDRRLRELGVDPEWKGIPAATFCQKMATLKHHQTIAEKVMKMNENQFLPNLSSLNFVSNSLCTFSRSRFMWVDNTNVDGRETG